jgi:2-polyprenyl-6-methoxyphenol hydroxylase-like FAD-dependent oxidoreductase
MAMTTVYDAIVVGARCAGSPTAMLLAGAGHRVLLVDRATLPSDTLSTHVIHAPGVAALRRWGVLDQVTATGCPPIDSYVFDFGPITFVGTPPPAGGGSTAYAPRRHLLDTMLVRAAADAGAEVREHFTVDDVVVEDGVAVGIRGHGPGGRTAPERARVVIGADGLHSRVARSVGAEEYLTRPKLQFGYYTYWRDLPLQGFHVVSRPDRAWGAIPTNDGLTLVVVGWPIAEARAYRADIEGNYLRTLDLVPEWGERVRDATRVEPFTGGGVPNFFRRPYGPGWALVGDAGYTKDPITAQGMSDAFRDAELCAGALDAVLRGERPYGEAMAGYHAARDARGRPIFEFTTRLATLAPPPPEVQQLLGAVSGSPAASDAFAGVVAGTVSPDELFAPDNVAAIMGAGRAA